MIRAPSDIGRAISFRSPTASASKRTARATLLTKVISLLALQAQLSRVKTSQTLGQISHGRILSEGSIVVRTHRIPCLGHSPLVALFLSLASLSGAT